MQWDFNKMTQVKVKERGLCTAGLGFPLWVLPPWDGLHLYCLLLQGPQLSWAEAPDGAQQLHAPEERILPQAEQALGGPAGVGFPQLDDVIGGGSRDSMATWGMGDMGKEQRKEFQEMCLFLIEMSNAVLQSDLSMRNSVG